MRARALTDFVLVYRGICKIRSHAPASSQDRAEFDRNGGGFERHIRFDAICINGAKEHLERAACALVHPVSVVFSRAERTI